MHVLFPPFGRIVPYNSARFHMFVLITSTSALEFWLSASNRELFSDPADLKRTRRTLPANYSADFTIPFIEETAYVYSLSLPVRVMVPDGNARHTSSKVRCSVSKVKLPPKSFIQLDRSVWVSSPELCLTQIASHYSFAKLVEFINNLCAGYGLDKKTRFQQRFCIPVTSLTLIRRFISDKTHTISGRRIIERALKYALENAYSPRECQLAVLLMLPFSQGGYAVKPPVLNKCIKLSAKAAKLLQRESVCCDMVWEEEKVILEYDSNLAHLDQNQHSFDKRKYTALSMDGYKVISVTEDQINSFRNVDNLFISLRRELGMRAKTAELEKYRDRRWEVVHELLFSKNNFPNK